MLLDEVEGIHGTGGGRTVETLELANEAGLDPGIVDGCELGGVGETTSTLTFLKGNDVHDGAVVGDVSCDTLHSVGGILGEVLREMSEVDGDVLGG